jgi:hypothetical protein
MNTFPIIVRTAGLLAGLAVAVTLVTSWRVDGGEERVGASVRLTASGRGELTVTPTGVLASGTALQAGGRALAATVDVRNITAVPLNISVRAIPSVPELDDKVAVQVKDGGLALVDGRLGADRAAAPFVLEPGESRSLRTTAWVPAGTTDYRGRAADVALTFDIDPGA